MAAIVNVDSQNKKDGRKMKKIIAMLLALVMVFALVACGNADKDDG